MVSHAVAPPRKKVENRLRTWTTWMVRRPRTIASTMTMVLSSVLPERIVLARALCTALQLPLLSTAAMLPFILLSLERFHNLYMWMENAPEMHAVAV